VGDKPLEKVGCLKEEIGTCYYRKGINTRIGQVFNVIRVQNTSYQIKRIIGTAIRPSLFF